MTQWTRTAGLLFLAAASVYSSQANSANAATPAKGKNPATEVKLLETAEPATDIFADPVDAPAASVETATAPVEGTSVRSTDIHLSEAGTVEIHVNDANLVEVLRMLSLQSQKNIIASKDVRGTVTANLYDVTVREALDAILHSNGYAYREKGNFIYIYTAKEIAEIEKANRVARTQVFRVFYTPAANAVSMIKPVLSSGAQVSFTTAASSGLQSGTGELGGNSHSTEDMIVVTDYEDNLAEVARILKEIDQRPQQILVEATILRASLTEDNALGVDFNILSGVDFTDVITSNGQVTNATIASGTPVDSRASGVGTGNNFAGPIAGGLKVGFVSQNVSVFLAALEGVTDTAILANPKILALNKQKGEVIVGRKDGYLTTTVTDSAAVQTVEFLDTGTRLIFRPFIGDDGYIRMEIHPEDSSGGLTSSNLPFKVTTEVTSNIMVKDGHTVVIGGLFRESTDIARSQVPFVGNVPFAGRLFKNQRDRSTREEIIIMLTPHIVKNDEAYAKAGEEALADANRIRIGMRQGLMPWGRERMAETNYERAVAEMNRPNPRLHRVNWHLDCAIYLNPKFIEAIKLKETVTGRQVSAVDNSHIRSFVRSQILADRALTPATQAVEDVTADGMPADENPPAATQPTVEVPSTQPVAEHPTTQPAMAIDDPDAADESIAAQPDADDVIAGIIRTEDTDVEAIAKSEASLDAPLAASTETTVEEREDSLIAERPMDETMPLDEAQAEPTVTVRVLEDDPSEVIITELPMDELPGAGENP